MSEPVMLSPLFYPVVSSEILHAYAQASGDHNPIHLDEDVAKKVGLPGRIAHGMLVAGWVSDRAARFCRAHFGGAVDWEFRDLQFRFKGMTLLGDQITVSGTAQPDAATEGLWSLELTAANQRGETTVTAQLTLVATQAVRA